MPERSLGLRPYQLIFYAENDDQVDITTRDHRLRFDLIKGQFLIFRGIVMKYYRGDFVRVWEIPLDHDQDVKDVDYVNIVVRELDLYNVMLQVLETVTPPDTLTTYTIDLAPGDVPTQIATQAPQTKSILLKVINGKCYVGDGLTFPIELLTGDALTLNFRTPTAVFVAPDTVEGCSIAVMLLYDSSYAGTITPGGAPAQS